MSRLRKIMRNLGHYTTFGIIQGHQFRYQWKAHIVYTISPLVAGGNSPYILNSFFPSSSFLPLPILTPSPLPSRTPLLSLPPIFSPSFPAPLIAARGSGEALIRSKEVWVEPDAPTAKCIRMYFSAKLLLSVRSQLTQVLTILVATEP